MMEGGGVVLLDHEAVAWWRGQRIYILSVTLARRFGGHIEVTLVVVLRVAQLSGVCHD
jgi:hypothetical protein